MVHYRSSDPWSQMRPQVCSRQLLTGLCPAGAPGICMCRVRWQSVCQLLVPNPLFLKSMICMREVSIACTLERRMPVDSVRVPPPSVT